MAQFLLTNKLTGEVATNKFANKPTKKNIPLSALSNQMAAWAEPKGRLGVTYYSV
jgi:hypothetical protein